MIDTTFLNWLRLLGIIEGCSTLLLFFVAMPLKYMADMPMAVSVAGSIHGALFVLLVVMFVVGKERIPLSTGLMLGGILGAVIPFGPFVTEIWLGRLAKAAPDPIPAEGE